MLGKTKSLLTELILVVFSKSSDKENVEILWSVEISLRRLRILNTGPPEEVP